MCSVEFKEEFSREHVALRFHKIEPFCEAQWRWPRAVFVTYRLLMSAYSLFAFTHTVVTLQPGDSPHHFMAYLTNWTYLLLTTFFFWGAVLALYHHLCSSRGLLHNSQRIVFLRDGSVDIEKQQQQQGTGKDNPVYEGFNQQSTQKRKASEDRTQSSLRSKPDENLAGNVMATSLPWYVQVYWLLSNIVQSTSFIITVIYFGALYSPSKGITYPDLNFHGINSLMVLIDVIVSARPVRVLHVLYPSLYGLAYIIFSVIFWAQDHENNVLYPNVLDWNHPGPSCGVALGLAVLGIPLVQCGHFGVYRLRLWVHHRLYGESYL